MILFLALPVYDGDFEVGSDFFVFAAIDEVDGHERAVGVVGFQMNLELELNAVVGSFARKIPRDKQLLAFVSSVFDLTTLPYFKELLGMEWVIGTIKSCPDGIEETYPDDPLTPKYYKILHYLERISFGFV